MAEVKTVLCGFWQPAGSAAIISSADQTHFLDQYSLSDTTLACSLARRFTFSNFILSSLAQPMLDSCTRLCFGYYTIERILGRLSQQSEEPVSSVLLDVDISSTSQETQTSSVSYAMDSLNMFKYEHLDKPVLSPETLPPIPSFMQELPDDDADTLEPDGMLLCLP
jgi:hypothetical protein